MVNDASSISRSGYTQNPRLAEAAFEGVRKNTDCQSMSLFPL